MSRRMFKSKDNKTIQIILDGETSSESETSDTDDDVKDIKVTLPRHAYHHPRIKKNRVFGESEIQEMGVRNWVENMFHMIDTGEVDEHSDHYINLAHEMIKRFGGVIFMRNKDRLGRKASNLIRKVRVKHHIKKEEVLEVLIDETRAARKVFRDLLKITGIRDLPQIFINETFVGSWSDLKTLHKTGLLAKELLAAVGFKDLFCPVCLETGGQFHDKH